MTEIILSVTSTLYHLSLKRTVSEKLFVVAMYRILFTRPGFLSQMKRSNVSYKALKKYIGDIQTCFRPFGLVDSVFGLVGFPSHN